MLKKFYQAVPVELFIFLLLMLYVVITPNNSWLTFDNKRIFEVGIIYINLIALFNVDFRGRLISHFYFFSPSIRISFIALLLLITLSATYAPLSRSAFLEEGLYLGLFLISMTVFSLFLLNKVIFNFLMIISLLVSCIVYQLNFFMLYFLRLVYKIPLYFPDLFTGFENIRFFTQYQVWLFFIINYPLFIVNKKYLLLIRLLKVTSIGWAILLFYSGSRGSVISILSGLCFSFIFFKSHALSFIKLNIKFLIYGMMGALFFFKLLPWYFGIEEISGWRSINELLSDTPRLYLLKLSLNYIITHPWLGIGPMHFAYFPNPISSYYPNPFYAHPHNSVLQYAAETGLPSALILLTITAYGIFLWIKKFKHLDESSEDRILWVVLFGTICSAFVYSLVDGVVVMPVSQVLMVIVIGWMFGLYFQFNTKAGIIKHHGLVLLGSIVLMMTLTYCILPSLRPRLLGVNASTREHPKLYDPRFWMQGHIPE